MSSTTQTTDSPSHQTAIVWFRRDLRLADNPALQAACATADTIIPLFIWAPEEEAPWQPGAASRSWLHHALAALQKDLKQHHAELVICQATGTKSTSAILRDIADTTGATAVFWNRLYEPAIIERDKAIKNDLKTVNIATHSSNGALLIEPWQIETKQDNPYRVFTPFWREAQTRIDFRAPMATPTISTDSSLLKKCNGLTLADLELLPKAPTPAWDESFYEHWTPSSTGAHDELEKFLDHRVHDYDDARNVPAVMGTSRLSPHLHFGTISPQQIAYRVQAFENRATSKGIDEQCAKYLSELGWREFAHHLLYHYPETTEQPLNPKFKDFPWVKPNKEKLTAWQQGKTGIPLVDAGMRELWQTGWMHNRVRMLVGSLLVKNIRYHWQHGAEWFWDTLVDANLANNTLGWQWIGGCGADAAPYFRIFNPITQAEKFDPQNRYIKTYIPELNSNDYPEPIVDLKTSRQEALEAYQKIK